ncbi:MAG: nucleotidyl transferase AbiEii/AbiGii toxin family protein [Candidatus Aminicenantes bacterium]|nr:nucleotidyl transferase AbiEii/AbiGii toxin family protein [Candidatus Aminicenantes bacterium]
MKKAELLPILKVLREAGVPFVLAGGYAVAAWGTVRATRDIDFIAAVAPDKIPALIKEFIKAGFKGNYRPGDEDDPVRGVIGLERVDAEAAEPVEIILGIKKMPADIFARARQIRFFGVEVPVTSPEDLIVLKCLAGGPVDQEDARSILKIMRDKLDLEYLKTEFKRCRLSLEKLNKK